MSEPANPPAPADANLTELRRSVRGAVIAPADPGYESSAAASTP